MMLEKIWEIEGHMTKLGLVPGGWVWATWMLVGEMCWQDGGESGFCEPETVWAEGGEKFSLNLALCKASKYFLLN